MPAPAIIHAQPPYPIPTQRAEEGPGEVAGAGTGLRKGAEAEEVSTGIVLICGQAQPLRFFQKRRRRQPCSPDLSCAAAGGD